ncbi:hypothetical protein DPV78_009055 [Talaromyces pinophilus]|nr:hypothetical protein DPV78_009055 [Talaromyces pinophilus]
MLRDAKVLWSNFLGQGKNSRSTKDDKFGLRVVSKEYLSTRNLCIGALFLGWTTSILCIVLGVYMIYVPLPLDSAFERKLVDIGTCTYCFSAGFEGNGEFNHSGHRIYAMSKTVQLLFTLCLNTTANVLLDFIGHIHATTLRWALVQENRLQMNSNLRFFCSSKTCFPNKWYMNAISLVGFIITFGALTSVTVDAKVVSGCSLKEGTQDDMTFYQTDRYQDGLDFNGAGIIALGFGILLQTFVSTYAISKSTFVATWSSDPLTNAKACHDYHVSTSAFTSLQCSNIPRGPRSESISAGPVSGMTVGRAPELHLPDIMAPSSTHSQIASKCTCRHITDSFPRERQPSMLSILPNACRIRYILWSFFGAFAIWSGTLVAIDYKIDNLKNLDNTSDEWKHFGNQYFSYADGSRLLRQDFIGLLIQTCVQSFICFSLHCIELLFNVSRDETVWRKAASVGIKTNPSPIKSFTNNWQSLVLMTSKSLIQWIFGYAFRADVLITMDLLPLVTMAGLYLTLSIFTECVIRHRPKGPQPVTYGDIQRLSFLIDEWDHDVLFWGDKGEVANGIRKAGTAGRPLSDIRLNAPYFGLVVD